MKTLALMLVIALSSTPVTATAQAAGSITFQGSIVEVPAGQPLTAVTPTTTLDAAQQPQTVYVVSSTVTKRTLAKFSTEDAARTYAAQVTPVTATLP